MRRGRLFLLVALLLIVVLVAVFVFMGGLTPGPAPEGSIVSQPPTSTPVPETINVVVVTQRVTRGTDFSEDVLGFVEIPKDLQIPGSYTDLSEVLGRRAKFDLDSGVILTANMTTESAEQFSTAGSDWALLIPPGRVAVSIPITRLTSVSYGPQKGDHVNVIVTVLLVDVDAAYQSVLPNSIASVIAPGFLGEPGQSPFVLSLQVAQVEGSASEGRIQPETQFQVSAEDEDQPFYYVVPSEPQRPRMVSQTLIQDAIVLQVGNFPIEEEKPAPTPTPEPGFEEGGLVEPDAAQAVPVTTPPPPPPPDLITLIVSPQDAVTLNYLIYSGAQLTLALRAANDASLVQTEAVTLQYLLDVYNLPVPVKLPFAIEPRVDQVKPPVLPNDATPTPTPAP